MNDFNDHGLRAGLWSGVLHTKAAPARVVVTHLSEIVAHAQVSPGADGEWQIQAQLPADLLSDGIHTLILQADTGTGDAPLHPAAARLAQLSILAGSVLADDLIAEIGHLRSELELLKREFRRQASGE